MHSVLESAWCPKLKNRDTVLPLRRSLPRHWHGSEKKASARIAERTRIRQRLMHFPLGPVTYTGTYRPTFTDFPGIKSKHPVDCASHNIQRSGNFSITPRSPPDHCHRHPSERLRTTLVLKFMDLRHRFNGSSSDGQTARRLVNRYRVASLYRNAMVGSAAV